MSSKKIIKKGYTNSQLREIEKEFVGTGIKVEERGNGILGLQIPVKNNIDYIKNVANAYDKYVQIDDRFVNGIDDSVFFKNTAASFFPSSSIPGSSAPSSGANLAAELSNKAFEAAMPKYGITADDPFTWTSAQYSDGREMIRVALALIKRDYMCRQVVESMAQFSNSGLILSGSTKKIRDFYEQWFASIKMRKLLGKIFKGYYGHGNPTLFRFSTPVLKKTIKVDKGSYILDKAETLKLYNNTSVLDLLAFNEDIKNYNIKKDFAAKKEIWSKSKLPVLYVLLNPLKVENISPSLFGLGESYYHLEDKVVESIKNEIKHNKKTNNSPIGNSYNKYPISFLRKVNELKKNQGQRILLDSEFAIQLFREKEDWENYATPMIWTSVPLLKYKNKLRQMDSKIIDSVINKILLITIGSKDNPATAKQMKYLSKILKGDNTVMTLLWNYTMKAEFIEPDMTGLNIDKYNSINKDIKESFGAPGMIFGGEGSANFSNSFMEIKTFSEKLHTGREDVSEDFIISEMEKVAEAMQFDNIPNAEFEPIKLRDENKLFEQLKDKVNLGALSIRSFAKLTGVNWEQEKPLLEEEQKMREKGLLPPIGTPGAKTKDNEMKPNGGRPQNTTKGVPDNISPEKIKKKVKPKEK